MRAKELLDNHDLSAAIAELNQDLKRQPTDVRLRTFLFELLSFAGDYERADRQLDVLGHQDEKTGIGIEVYRSLLRAEIARRRFFQEGVRPVFLFDPSEYVSFCLDACDQLREGHVEAAKTSFSQAEKTRAHVRGRLRGDPFNSFRDTDDRLAGVLEVFARDSYIWLPFERIRKLVVSAPKHLRDLLWIPATIEMEECPVGEVFLPVIYAGSERVGDDKVRLGNLTEWVELGAGLAGGLGQKTFAVDDQEVSILQLGELEFEAVVATMKE